MGVRKLHLVVALAAAVAHTEAAAQAVQAARGTAGQERVAAPERDTVIAESTISLQAIDAKKYADVVFAVGYEYTDDPTAHTFSVTTNLLGAAVGTAFDALGADQLKDYLTDNLSGGFSVPTEDDQTISGSLGVGIGGIRLSEGLALFPVLAFEQSDTSDARVPDGLIAANPGQKTWTRPTLSVSIVFPELLERVGNGELGFVATVGVRLPHYYSGNAFDALGALFTSSRSDYRRAGEAQWTFGIAIPLMRPNRVLSPNSTTSSPGSR